MKCQCLYFTGPRQISVREEVLAEPGPGQVLVATQLSAISPGTELLIYRGEFPTGLDLDENLPALSGGFAYPLRYGYACAGRVSELGQGVSEEWLGRTVFGFQPHASHFVAPLEELLPLPEGLPLEQAVFLPNMETALNFLMDGAPLVGEQVAVLGQGVVGLLTTALLAQLPLSSLVTLDRFPRRREISLAWGATTSLDPGAPQIIDTALPALQGEHAYQGADLVYELSGNPAALDLAIALSGYHGRVVIGSWYGEKRASLNLGGRFHRSRVRLISSQVSRLAPELSGRWDKARRFQLAWEQIGRIRPARLITQCLPLSEAAEAYRLLDETPGEAIQVVLAY
jgi:2-desacetyl-2-hydroxyethyl bacteriochlorophyllide A dehydrogenase